MPALSLDRSAIAGAPIEPVGYYRHWYGGYYPYRYYRPYGYYRPYHRYGYYYGYY
jgi:hypothetical protein